VPEGWGDRVCTLILVVGPSGLQLPISIVFKGQGKYLKEAESALYNKLTHVMVHFQENAWVDAVIEREFIKNTLALHVSKLRERYAAGQFPGVLLLQDNFKPHFNEYLCLWFRFTPNNCLIRNAVKDLSKLDVFTAALPSQVTDCGQTVDDTVGKTFKSDLNAFFCRYLESFDMDKTNGKVSAMEKRMKTAEFVNQVAEQFNAKHLDLIQNSCMRTGMYLTIDESDLEKMVPVKYSIRLHRFPFISYSFFKVS
jgi:hypothetical protein